MHHRLRGCNNSGSTPTRTRFLPALLRLSRELFRMVATACAGIGQFVEPRVTAAAHGHDLGCRCRCLAQSDRHHHNLGRYIVHKHLSSALVDRDLRALGSTLLHSPRRLFKRAKAGPAAQTCFHHMPPSSQFPTTPAQNTTTTTNFNFLHPQPGSALNANRSALDGNTLRALLIVLLRDDDGASKLSAVFQRRAIVIQRHPVVIHSAFLLCTLPYRVLTNWESSLIFVLAKGQWEASRCASLCSTFTHDLCGDGIKLCGRAQKRRGNGWSGTTFFQFVFSA